MQLPNHGPGKLDMLSQHAKHNQAIQACSCPITGQEAQTHYPSIHSTDKLFQHALQNLHCIKEAAEAQNSRQADTAK